LRVDDVAAARTELESPGVLQGPGRQPPDPCTTAVRLRRTPGRRR